jgi:transposase
MSTRRKYDRQFKIDTIRHLENSGKKGSEVARDLGIRHDLISRWKKELSEDNIRAFPGSGNPRDEEIAKLKRELADVKMERDILKKAVAIFSKPENRNIGS